MGTNDWVPTKCGQVSVMKTKLLLSLNKLEIHNCHYIMNLKLCFNA